jgi:Fur family peroxide stress response transcriptional regulator
MRTSSVDQVILATFAESHAHLTSREIYDQIRERLPAVNPSTVYRSLDRLVKRGEVSVSDMGTGSAVYELVADDIHHHMVCQVCGKVTTLGHEEVGEFFHRLEAVTGFEVTTNHLVLFGVCPHCRERSAPQSMMKIQA